jgi:hypothetical protein
MQVGPAGDGRTGENQRGEPGQGSDPDPERDGPWNATNSEHHQMDQSSHTLLASGYRTSKVPCPIVKKAKGELTASVRQVFMGDF